MSDETLIHLHNFFVDFKRGMREIATPARIGHPFGNRAEPPGETSEDLIAIWDTGATSTTVTREIADRLNLTQSGETWVEGVTGPALCRIFLVSLYLPNNVCFPELEISDCEGNIGCDILIGMDVIGKGDFAVCNKGGVTTFSFRLPSAERIDFTEPYKYGGHTMRLAKPLPNDPCPCGSGKKYKKCCKGKRMLTVSLPKNKI